MEEIHHIPHHHHFVVRSRKMRHKLQATIEKGHTLRVRFQNPNNGREEGEKRERTISITNNVVHSIHSYLEIL